MIERYSRKLMREIWSEQNKYQIWLKLELAVAEGMEKYKIIPRGISSYIRKKSKIKVERIHKIEEKVKHDVIAFLTSISETSGFKGRFLHQGLTSSDILDTCFNLQLRQSAQIIDLDLKKLMLSLKKISKKHKNSVCIGRSHGIHAEPTTFGLKFASFYEEFKRNRSRLSSAIQEISTCAISGAVGTFANIDPRIEKHVSKKMNLLPEPISTQIIPRDRHAFFFSVLGIIASSIERLAVEIRHLQRTEVSEASEHFSLGQKGSSAMPHKKNPILSENLTGLSRLVRSYVAPSLENVALWHERDISHSSVERNIGPDSTITLDFALNRLNEIVKNLDVFPKKMLNNTRITNGLIFSQRIMLELTKKGMSREKSYKIVQKNAMAAWKKNKSFESLISEDKSITKILSKKEISNLFKFDYHTKKVNYIFKRVFK